MPDRSILAEDTVRVTSIQMQRNLSAQTVRVQWLTAHTFFVRRVIILLSPHKNLSQKCSWRQPLNLMPHSSLVTFGMYVAALSTVYISAQSNKSQMGSRAEHSFYSLHKLEGILLDPVSLFLCPDSSTHSRRKFLTSKSADTITEVYIFPWEENMLLMEGLSPLLRCMTHDNMLLFA